MHRHSTRQLTDRKQLLEHIKRASLHVACIASQTESQLSRDRKAKLQPAPWDADEYVTQSVSQCPTPDELSLSAC